MCVLRALASALPLESKRDACIQKKMGSEDRSLALLLSSLPQERLAALPHRVNGMLHSPLVGFVSQTALPSMPHVHRAIVLISCNEQRTKFGEYVSPFSPRTLSSCVLARNIIKYTAVILPFVLYG